MQKKKLEKFYCFIFFCEDYLDLIFCIHFHYTLTILINLRNVGYYEIYKNKVKYFNIKKLFLVKFSICIYVILLFLIDICINNKTLYLNSQLNNYIL